MTNNTVFIDTGKYTNQGKTVAQGWQNHENKAAKKWGIKLPVKVPTPDTGTGGGRGGVSGIEVACRHLHTGQFNYLENAGARQLIRGLKSQNRHYCSALGQIQSNDANLDVYKE